MMGSYMTESIQHSKNRLLFLHFHYDTEDLYVNDEFIRPSRSRCSNILVHSLE